MCACVRILPALLFVLLSCVSTLGQTPKLYLKFDGDLLDSSTAGILSSASPQGFTPSYGLDRNSQTSKALVLPGSASVKLLTALAGNSNESFGLRNAAGSTTKPFTAAAWVFLTATSGQNIVFGNASFGTGTPVMGASGQTPTMNFDGAIATTATTFMAAQQWYHLVFIFDGTSQRIYVNGNPEIVRAASNTIKAGDLLLGNWFAETHATNDFIGRLDDVVIYDVALTGGQVQALFNGVDPNALPATYSGPKLPGFLGTTDRWGVREIRGYPGINLGSLVNADRVIRNYAVTPGGTVAEYQTQMLNMLDPESAGNSGNFANEATYGTNTGADDNHIAMIAKCAVRITVEDDYTFGFRGDDGSRLRVLGKQFLSSTRIATSNVADPAHQGDGIYFPNGGGDTHTLGVVHLEPGDYNIEYTWFEGTGTSSLEVFAARGAKTAFDSAFALVGNVAGGGLPLVRDPDTVPGITSFTVNGGSNLFVHGGSPANFTLAWNTNAVATSRVIDQGIGAVAQTGSMNIATPAATTTYTITQTNGADVATKSATVYVNSTPVINSFTATPSEVVSGGAVTLNWSVLGATSLTLNPGNINVTGQTSRVVNPTSNTTYTLVATNPAGNSQQSVNVSIGTPPVINSFTVADPNPLYGAETTLSWNVTGTIGTISINQGVGAISGNTGSVSVSPIQTTTYTLTVVNQFGTVTANATVNQATPIGVSAAGFTARRVSATTAFPFAGKGYLASAIAVLGADGQPAQNAGTTTTQSGYTTINFADGADGEFTGSVGFPGGGGDNFAVQITGTLIVNTPGEYTFVLNSDDGGRLRVDGKDVVVDDSTHAPNSNSGRIAITKPSVAIEIIYYDATGGAEVELAWIRPNQTWQLISTVAAAAPIVRGQVLISEFMAENNGTLVDEDGDSSDWIEVWNSTAAPVNLGAANATYYLTDELAVPNKWPFPAKTLAANEFLVVFASTKDRRNPAATLHTNFNLSNNGEYLALTKDNGAGGFTVISSFAPTYPEQDSDVSYGSSDAEGYIGYMEVPTPGAPNAATVIDFVDDTSFSHIRGRYTTPFSLTISTTTPGASIRYTTDGSTPSANKGTVYSGPIAINGTTAVRAIAFKAGWKPTNVDTQSYLFVDDIVTQTNNTAYALGFPVSPASTGQVYRYGMSLTNVTAGGGTLQSLKNALAAVPSVCITTDIANLVDSSIGIYTNPSKHGLFWERPCSMEYINAGGGSEFQIDCGVRLRGGASRAVSNPKHAFHMFFRGLYDGDLKYRLFGASGAAQFDQIDLRCEQNNSWSKDNSSLNALLREEWSRATQRDMGQPYARDGYFHLYLNGIYWGIFNFEERTEAAFGESYLGGLKDNMDTVKSAGSTGGYNTEMTDGNFAAWQLLYTLSLALKNSGTEVGRTALYMQMRGLNPDGTPNAAFPVLLDVDNLIDYQLVQFYDGSFDSPMSTFLANASNNWFGVRDRLGSRGFAFFAHDHEHGMGTGTQSYNRVGPWGDPVGSPGTELEFAL